MTPPPAWVRRALTEVVDLEDPTGARDAALLALVDLGMDVEEIARLRAAHVCWAGEVRARRLVVRWRSGARTQQLEVPEWHASWLRDYLIRSHRWGAAGPLFPGAIEGRALSHRRLQQVLTTYRRQVDALPGDHHQRQPQEATG